jgi:hypothetical protein
MTEPVVALTDYALGLECAILARLIARTPTRHPDARTWAVLFFVTIGIAAVLGGTVHAFFPDPRTTGALLLWPGALLAVGLTALTAWGLGATIVLAPSATRWVVVAAASGFVAYAFLISLTPTFAVAVAHYLPGVVFLLAVLLVAHRRRPEGPALVGAAGLALTLVAALLQQAGVGMHRTYFNHNALYHVVQGAALVLVYVGVRWLAQTSTPSAYPS